MRWDLRIQERLDELKMAGLYRDPWRATEEAMGVGAGELIDVRSNDYLGLAASVASQDEADEGSAKPASERGAVSRETALDGRDSHGSSDVALQTGGAADPRRGGRDAVPLLGSAEGPSSDDGDDARVEDPSRAVTGRSSVATVGTRALPSRADESLRARASVSRETQATPVGAGALSAPKERTGRATVGAVGPASEAVTGGGGPPLAGAAPSSVSRETSSPLGAGAARLISGTSREHIQLEDALARWLGADSALLFASAYAANLGTVSALAQSGDVVFSDALNHASIIDGCRLSRAQVVVVPHRDPDALEHALSTAATAPGARWVVTESYFGMDGTSPDFHRLRAICDAWGAALLVDEAHSLGTFGVEGRGLCAAAGVRPDLLTGGFGKAFGLQGGFTVCSSPVRAWLWNRARSFVFSTATSPWLSARALERLRTVRNQELLRDRLQRHARRLEQRLLEEGVELPPGRHGPVFPILFGLEALALDAAQALRRLGVLAHPIRPPTVPPGTARIRITLRADMTDAQIDQVADAVQEVWRQRAPARRATSPARNPGTPLPPSEAPVALAEEAVEERHGAAKRWLVLGTGTGVGKSFFSEALVSALRSGSLSVAGLKPIETGCRTHPDGSPAEGDAARLEAASFHVKHPRPHPLYAFTEPLTPSLAARRAGQAIAPEAVASWVDRAHGLDSTAPAHLVIETAGGVFSPLAEGVANYDLALSLSPAIWVLIAPDRLGVLHDVSSTVRAMQSLGRAPDCVLLNPLPPADSSSGTNAAELRRLDLGVPVLQLGASDSLLALLSQWVEHR